MAFAWLQKTQELSCVKLETLDEVPSRAKIRPERFKPHRCNSVGTEPIRIDTKKFHSAIDTLER